MAENEGMRDLIQLINALQDAASAGGMNLGQLDLPQIVVVGEQSAGKSSVLENFVGRDFLPRGSGIVTRRPLVLQLRYDKNEEYAEFLHHPGKKLIDFHDVQREIQAETDRTTTGKGISKAPINLRIHSPNVLDLTLVDLPGITQVPVGNQPQDITKQILDMIQEYISQDNTLILAVSPANQDLANSSALKLAKSVDPEGLRTIGVVTKLDLMDKGTDAKDVLDNKTLPLHRGYIGLVNRSQADIDMSKDIQLAQQAEMKFFSNHEAYRHMADRMGTKYLQQILNEQLCEHIRDKMPVIKANLKQQYQDVRRELESIQAFSEERTDAWMQATIIKVMQNFSEAFRVFVEGHSAKADGSGMNAGARINYCVYGSVFKLLDQMVAPSEKEVKILIQNEHGRRNALYVSELVVDVVVGKLLKNYSEPMNKSVDLVSDIISTSIKELSQQLAAYPRLKNAVKTLLVDKLKTNEETTKKHLQIHLKAQGSFINTRHPEFHRIVERSDIPGEFNPTTSFQGNVQGVCRSDSIPTPSYAVSASSDGFERSPQPARKKSLKPEYLHAGWMTVFPNGLGFPSKRYWFRLTNDVLVWYTSENIKNSFTKKDKDPTGSVYLEDLQLVINSKNGRYNLEKTGRSPSNQLKSMTVAFGTQSEEDEWDEALQKAGMEKANDKPSNSDWLTVNLEAPDVNKFPVPKEQHTTNLQHQSPLYEKVDKDVEIQDWCDKIVHMVYSYMKIVDKTIHDIVPKYIYHLLIDETMEYLSKELLADLLKDDSWRDFLEVSPREFARREALFQRYNSTKKAIDMIKSADIFSEHE